jgi:hypothetical protein
MSFRLYIVPVIGTGTKADYRRPKYFDDGSLASHPAWSWIDYGFEPWAVVGADLSTSEDNFVVGQPDGFALPFDLSPPLTAQQVTNVKNKLESIQVPSGWVNTTLSWIQVVRTVLGVFTFIQRYGVVYADANGVAAPSIFTGGVSLDTTFGSLPLAVRNALIATAQSFGIPTAGLTANTTLRTILKSMADSFQNKQYNFNGTLI